MMVVAGLVLLLVVVTAWQALAQPGPGGGQAPGGFAGMMGPGWPPAPAPVVVVADGVVYVACDGKLAAYEVRTLKPLAEAKYWERPEQQ
jgi:hypothetical protein